MGTLRFTSKHEWVRVDADGSGTVGITDYAQDQLGDIVYVELPESGSYFAAGAEMAVVESVKAVGEVYMPVGGTVEAVNTRLTDEPELVNADPTGEGWLIKFSVETPGAMDDLMTEDAYRQFVAGLAAQSE
ncbi:MAG: glycine cleavage system protein GcvH [Gammaproteobacteria bacterium]